jgi:hypothetical protein
MDQNNLLHEPRHQGVPSGVSKTILEPMVHLAQTVHLSCIDTDTVSERTELRFHMTHGPRSSIGCVQNDFLSQWYVWRKPCTYLVSQLALSPNGLNELPLEPRHLRVPSGASKTISDPMVHLMEAVHLSCTNANTTSKWTEMTFDMTHIT